MMPSSCVRTDDAQIEGISSAFSARTRQMKAPAKMFGASMLFDPVRGRFTHSELSRRHCTSYATALGAAFHENTAVWLA
ncbi:hypothetical protein D3C86_1354570 [compost metagenome]